MRDDSAPRTFGALLLAAAGRWPDQEAVVFPAAQLADGRRTWAQLAASASARAQQLRELGVQPGEVVALLLPNQPALLEWVGAVSLVGAIAAPLNPRLRDTEIAFLLRDSGAGVVIRDGRAPARLAAAGTRPTPAGHAPALLVYTSGTTAEPKGCPVRDDTWLAAGAALADNYGLRAGDRLWDPLPMCHMAALHPFAACALTGTTFVSMTRFDAPLALQALEDERIDILYAAFPTILADLVNAPGFDAARLPRIRRINCVAPPGLLRTLQAALPGAALTSVYGLSEAGGVVAYGRAEDTLEERVTTCGRAFEGLAMRVVDADGTPCAHGVAGEVQLHGWCVFDGYWHQPEATRAALTGDGWLRTGDLGSLDEAGRLRFHGRLKDVLKVGGENVSAVEVESVLARHPAVKLAQVVGAPDARLGEVAAAFIELRPGVAASDAELIAHCRESLAGFKVPREVHFVSEWPMSATKVQKFRLRERLWGAA